MKNLTKQYLKRDIEKITNELTQISQKDGLTAENVVNNAKNKASPLHRFFEWDNSIAAQEWRLQQARVLINVIKVKIMIDGSQKSVGAFENIKITIDGGSFREYKPTIEILSNLGYRKQMMLKAIGEIKYWQEKYNIFKEFNPIFNEINKAEGRLKIKWQNKKKQR